MKSAIAWDQDQGQQRFIGKQRRPISLSGSILTGQVKAGSIQVLDSLITCSTRLPDMGASILKSTRMVIELMMVTTLLKMLLSVLVKHLERQPAVERELRGIVLCCLWTIVWHRQRSTSEAGHGWDGRE